MALTLEVDNTGYHEYLGALMRAVYHDATTGPMPANLKALLLALDFDHIERDLKRAMAMGL